MVFAKPQASIPQIKPISDLRANLNEVCEVARETQEPIFMTKNGKPALVVFDSEAYENMLQHERAVWKLREAEIEANYTKEKPMPLSAVKKRVAAIIAGADERVALSA